MDGKVKLEIPDGCYGEDLKKLMFKFVNLLPLINERRDNIEYQKELQSNFLEMVLSEAFLKSEGKNAIEKKAIALNLEVTINDKTTSAYKEQNILSDLKYKLSRAKSRTKELETLIDVCRSGLSFDKRESVIH